MRHITPIVIATSLALSGCVTTQGASSEQPSLLLSLGDIFDSKLSDLKSLVKEKRMQEARDSFNKNSQYFRDKYKEKGRDVPDEILSLADWHYISTYGSEIDAIRLRLSKIQIPSDEQGWGADSELLQKAKGVIDSIVRDDLLYLAQNWTNKIAPLDTEISRVNKLYVDGREKALSDGFGKVIQSGNIPTNYPENPFRPADYLDSTAFQDQLYKVLIDQSLVNDRIQDSLFTKYDHILADATKNKLKKALIVDKSRSRWMSDGKFDLAELGELHQLIKTHGELSDLAGIVRVGYVDLTAESFKNRNVFDFEIVFNKDYGIEMLDAKQALLGEQSLKEYDFIFLTDLSAAKIFREFKNKQEKVSKTQTGTRQEPNPEYVQATTDYQRAMNQLQSTQLNNAVQSGQSCYGWACALGAVLRGVGEGISQSAVQEKAAKLANTPQYITLPVYSEYSYQYVDINTSKVAKVDYYIIDVKNKQYYKSDFELKDHEKFVVAYNVSDKDPDRSSVLSNTQKEEDVTAWEKKPATVSLSALFDINNISEGEPKKFMTAEAFLRPIATRGYASATPIYSNSADGPQTYAMNVTTSRGVRSDSSTIADERFDSVVIIKNANSIGTGFYVTPELILTAYHVVDKASLVEMTFYDGTKSYGKVVDHDIRLDLALVKAQTAGKPVKIHSGPIRLGETAEAIGHPKGYEFTITRGVVSAVRKQKGQVIKGGEAVEFIQTDTPISPGNSGGPLFLKDTVIGVNDWVRVDKASQNLNFSVSFNEIRNYLDRFEGKDKR